jgi:hypothetical protein
MRRKAFSKPTTGLIGSAGRRLSPPFFFRHRRLGPSSDTSLPRWTKVRPGMTCHRLRLPNLISSPTPPSSSSPIIGHNNKRVLISVPKWAPHSVIDRRALTESSAISGRQSQARFTQARYSTAQYTTEPSLAVPDSRASPAVRLFQHFLYCNYRGMQLAKRGPIDIDLLTPFSPIHSVWKHMWAVPP